MTGALFDPGLQPERTQLAWRRTALAIAVGSIVAWRILPGAFGDPAWYVPGLVGVLFSACLWWISARRYRTFTAQPVGAEALRAPGAVPLLGLAMFTVSIGAFGIVAVARVGS